MSSEFITGITSGIVTTIFVFTFRSVWHSSIIPWFEERIYKDIKIEGDWFSFYPEASDERSEKVEIARRGHAITGSMTCINGPDRGEKYILTGSFRNMILPLIYESANRNKSDRGALSLRITSNGQRMVGKISMYFDHSDQIISATVVWFRSKNELENYMKHIRSRSKRVEVMNQRKRHLESQIAKAEGIKDIKSKRPIESRATRVSEKPSDNRATDDEKKDSPSDSRPSES